MKMPNRGRSDRGALLATVESVVTAGAVVLMLGSIIGLVVLIGSAVARPQIGDMLLFKPGGIAGENVIIPAQRGVAGAGAAARCDLNPAVMAEAGGSIVVEGGAPAAGWYRVHWAGVRTSYGAQDCGRSAELVLSTHRLRQLVGAIGGRGLISRGNVF